MSLEKLAQLLKERNKISTEIAHLIGRPALSGHIGEYIASQIFDIELNESATHKGTDGTFRTGPLQGKTVNVKLYGKKEGILDINTHPADYYLVLTGPNTPPTNSREADRPTTINQAFLFNTQKLRQTLEQRKIHIGIATSVTKNEWHNAMIHPDANNPEYKLSKEQATQLELFT
jgi:hypothetical protein